VYTGHETKLMLNSTSAPLKRSTVDQVVNKQVCCIHFSNICGYALFYLFALDVVIYRDGLVSLLCDKL